MGKSDKFEKTVKDGASFRTIHILGIFYSYHKCTSERRCRKCAYLDKISKNNFHIV